MIVAISSSLSNCSQLRTHRSHCYYVEADLIRYANRLKTVPVDGGNIIHVYAGRVVSNRILIVERRMPIWKFDA